MPNPKAIASVDVYAPLTGDPVKTKNGSGHYDLLERSAEGARFSVGIDGFRKLEVKEKIGVTCRPIINPKDTRLSDFDILAGNWDEWRPTVGGYRVYRIRHFSAIPNELFGVQSKYTVPENGDFALELLLPDVPAEQDFATYPPFIRIEVSDTWAISIERSGKGTALLQKISGAWEQVLELPNPSPVGGQSAIWVFWRWINGQIQISFDFGKEYISYPECPDPDNPVWVPSGKIAFWGMGGIATIGRHQLAYSTGTIDTAPKDYLETFLLATPSINGIYQNPYLSGVTFSNISQGNGRYAQARVALTPVQRGAYPWNVWNTPSIQSLTFRYPNERVTTVPSITQPWDPWLEAVDVSWVPDLDGANCTIRLDKKAWEALTPASAWRWRKVRVKLGYRWEDGSTEWFTVFTGYTREPRIARNEFGHTWVDITVDNATVRFKRAKWGPFDQVPLGGLVPNDAADYILMTEGLVDETGLDTSYRNWSTFGGTGLIPLEFGSPWDPGYLIQPNEDKWATFQRIWEPYGMQMGADNLGVYYTVPLGYIEPTVTHNYRATPVGASDYRELIDSVSNVFDSSDQCTAIAVIGTLPNGYQIIKTAIDVGAETVAGASNVCPWREWYIEEMPGTVSPGAVFGRAQVLATERFPDKWFADISTPVDLRVRQFQRVAVWGCAGDGIPDGKQHYIKTVSHSYRRGSSLTALKTQVMLERTLNDV